MRTAAVRNSAESSSIPAPAELRPRAYPALLVALAPEQSAAGEAVRALRTHVMAQHLEHGRRALAICAASSGVGCTFVASNLAIALSQIGVKTLLIDTNMRNPAIDKLFETPPGISGLKECLTEGVLPTSGHIAVDVLPDLSVIFSGGIAENAQELLATNDFADLMSFCLRDYQMTILDTAPANVCSDALRVSSVAGYSMIVARRDRSRVSDVGVLASQLQGDGGRVIGTVMTED